MFLVTYTLIIPLHSMKSKNDKKVWNVIYKSIIILSHITEKTFRAGRRKEKKSNVNKRDSEKYWQILS